MIRKICPVIFLLAACCVLHARPLNIIIVTGTDSSEDGYAEFLRDIYMDNANVEIDDNRYQEPLNDTEKQELLGADLIIVSSDNSGGDYDNDSAFWASLPVPILSHNIGVCRSDNHENWDWFGSDKIKVFISEFYPIDPNDPNDPIFDGIDLTAGSVTLFDSVFEFFVPDDDPYTGNGTPLAVNSSGRSVIVRFDGNEPNYYDGSLYNPNNTPRIYFALPNEPATFFENATPAAKQLLRNAVTALLPECWLPGDIDCDRDVDMSDFSGLAVDWQSQVPLQSDPPLTDIIVDGQVNIDDFAVLAMFWLEGFDNTPPSPDPSEWTDIPAIQDGSFIQMKINNSDDDLHGVQYNFECLENALYSSGWQYDREYFPANLPIGADLSFRAKTRDTSSRLNETFPSSIQTVRTDGLFYYSADASAAVALDDHRFIMADDEFNILQVYNWDAPASNPNRQTDVSAAIAVDPVPPGSRHRRCNLVQRPRLLDHLARPQSGW